MGYGPLAHFKGPLSFRAARIIHACVKRPLSKRLEIGFHDQLSLYAGPAILSTFIKLPFVIMIFVLSIFVWPFYTGFTALNNWEKWILQNRENLHYRKKIDSVLLSLFMRTSGKMQQFSRPLAPA